MEEKTKVRDKVSIITPSFNCQDYISKTIDSVLSQTYSNWEMIIVDDCSTDNSVEIIQNYCAKDKRIKLFISDKNMGSGRSRNKCLEKATGRYIAFLDSDDYWSNIKLERQIAFMEENSFNLTYSMYFEFDSDTGRLLTKVKVPKKVNFGMLLKNGGYMGCLTVIYDSYFFGKRDMPEIRKRQDWALWLKMLKEIDYAHGLQEPLAYYRLGNSSLSKSKLKLVKYNFSVYRKELRMSFLRSLYHMIVFLIHHFFYKPKLKVKL
ncbi:glycosyltransferase family 2 protein [Hyunsoonleella rubra]|uniref:Glycosyltransferase family 2 protein n=1 Tax=Hyunsoonleella rubra TaxID=1737062 RepID=A0ABW5T6S1_9FLAO